MGFLGRFSRTFGAPQQPPEPGFPVMAISAAEVTPGMTVVAIADGGIWPHADGSWPLVDKAEYWDHGERGKPTMYITLDDDPTGEYPCRPDELVTVASESETEAI